MFEGHRKRKSAWAWVSSLPVRSRRTWLSPSLSESCMHSSSAAAIRCWHWWRPCTSGKAASAAQSICAASYAAPIRASLAEIRFKDRCLLSAYISDAIPRWVDAWIVHEHYWVLLFGFIWVHHCRKKCMSILMGNSQWMLSQIFIFWKKAWVSFVMSEYWTRNASPKANFPKTCITQKNWWDHVGKCPSKLDRNIINLFFMLFDLKHEKKILWINVMSWLLFSNWKGTPYYSLADFALLLHYQGGGASTFRNGRSPISFFLFTLLLFPLLLRKHAVQGHECHLGFKHHTVLNTSHHSLITSNCSWMWAADLGPVWEVLFHCIKQMEMLIKKRANVKIIDPSIHN